jgi:hypothetical protein
LDRTLVAGLAAGVSDHAGLVVTLAQHFADVIKISTQLITPRIEISTRRLCCATAKSIALLKF